MNVTLCSAFRNASGYIDRFIWQEIRLRKLLGERGGTLSLILAEGDSVDDTGRILSDEYSDMPNALLLNVSHGGADYGSIVNAERFANLAKVWNAIWQRIPADADAVLFVESDLVWEPATMLALLDDLAEYPAVAPMVMLRREGYDPNFFYDNWGYWRGGVQIGVMPPYFAELNGSLLELDSAGSCIAMRGDIARGLTWPPEDVARGVCRQIRVRGGSVWLNPKVSVIHE